MVIVVEVDTVLDIFVIKNVVVVTSCGVGVIGNFDLALDCFWFNVADVELIVVVITVEGMVVVVVVVDIVVNVVLVNVAVSAGV